MNTRTLYLVGCLATVSLSHAQSPAVAPAAGESQSWRQLIRQWPKAGAELEVAGDQATDVARYTKAVAHYEAWRDMPGSSPEQKALATIKLAQLAEIQFEIDRARSAYLQALSMVPPASGIAYEIRLRIEDSYRRQGDLPGLVKVWQGHLQAHGDDPEAGLLLANALAELRRPEESALWPHKVSLKPADTHRLDAALAARRAGDIKKELAELRAAFDAESDPLVRLELAGALGNVTARADRLDDLIGSFRTKSRAEADGWRYAVYLAEIQRSSGNAAGAQEELARAFGPRSRDPLFVTEAWRIRYDQHNPAERARLARLLAQIAPGTPREIELVSALLQNKENSEALKGLRANEDTLATDPMPWHDALLEAGAAGLGTATASLLESLLVRQPADWRLRFLLAEARLQTGDLAGAEKLFREVEAAAPATAPAIAPATDAPEEGLYHFINGFTYNSGTAQGPALVFARRNTESGGVRQLVQSIATGFNRGLSGLTSRRAPFPSSGGSELETPFLKTPRAGADAALVIRSVLAQQQGKGAEFVTELQASLAGLPRAERIARLTLVQALDPLLQELTTEADTPSGDEQAQAIGLEALLCLSWEVSPMLGRVNVDASRLIPLLKTFLSREKHPETLILGKAELSRLLKAEGQEKEAAALAREALDQWATLPAQHRSRLLEFALETGDIDHVEAMLAAMAEEARQSGAASAEYGLVNYEIKLASVIAQQKANDPGLVDLLATTLRHSFALRSASLSNQAILRVRSALQQAQKFPYGSRLIEIRSWTWSMIARHGQTPALRAALARQIPELPPERALLARLAGICFAWWSHDRDTAIRETLDLATTQPSDDLSLLAGSMLAEAGRYDEAQAWFERISTTDEQIRIDQVVRLLSLARARHDTERARALARQLTELPISDTDRMLLPGILNDLDLKELAITLRTSQQAKNETAFYTGVAGAVQRMQQETRAGHAREAVELARGILARISPSEYDQTERYHRSTALDTLRQFKALTDYTEELNRQLEADPKSTATLLRLAEALGRNESAQSVALYRRAIEAHPDDLSLQRLLARALSNGGQAEEARRAWEGILARDPQSVFGDDFTWILNSYRSAKQLDLLAALLVKMPAPSNPLEALVFFARDTSNTYQQLATALRSEHKLPEAIQVWQASLARARAIKASPYVESTILQSLLPALLEAGRKDEAAQEIENYFFPPAPPHPVLGYEVRSSKRPWTELTYGMDGREEPHGTAVMNAAVDAGALDRVRAKAAAARPRDPEHLLVLWVDVLRRDPAQLEHLQKEFDEVLADLQPAGHLSTPDRIEIAGDAGMLAVQTPWTSATASVLRALADLLAQQPESRALALHVLEKTPDIGGQKGWIALRRAQVALSIPDQAAATRALGKWLAWNDDPLSVLSQADAAQQLTAAELLSKANMTAEASALFQRTRASGSLQTRSDLKKRVDELSERLGSPAEGRQK